MKNNETLITLAGQLEIDTEMLKEILILFFENMPGQIGNMRSDVKKKDFNSIHVISHTLKGTSANLHYKEISTTAGEIEQLALNSKDDSAEYEPLFNKLTLLLSRAKSQIFYK